MPTRVAINGLGRIGEMVLRHWLHDARGVEIVAINDLAPLDQLAYALRYDSVHPAPPTDIASGEGWLRADGREVKAFQQRDPALLPWADLGVDLVIEATGAFEARDGMAKHITAGAKRVVLTSPAKDDGADVTICMGVNDGVYDPALHHLISNASCTTNCLAPVLRALDEAFGVDWAMVSTVHAYTGSQALVDVAAKGRRGRAAALNIVPTSTGAAKAIGLVLPHLAGKVDGMAYRVPVPDGSVIDVVCQLGRDVDADAINARFRAAATDTSFRGVLAVTDDEIVSSDIVGRGESAIVDLPSTMVLGGTGRVAKVVAWYDNEWGYAGRVMDLVHYIGDNP
ncbi:MAG: type I glyceraldehyde-3-phosphate dehydrogenase [Ardenticatenales bacterium]|nr:type I glyceraldehyde-3-phosphate dehydrogenase [Ardenticatenales bacterium]